MTEDVRPGQLRLDAEHLPSGETVLTAVGEIDIATAPDLREALESAAGRATPGAGAVLDLAGVIFMDSTGLGALNAARVQAEALGVAWRLAGLQPPVRRLLDLTGVGDLFAVFPDRESALAG